MRKDPIFIVSSERSGSNLLRMKLTENQQKYFGPSPAHLLKNLQPIMPSYGDLLMDKNFEALINDAIKLCTIHFSPWDIELVTADIHSKYNQTDYPRNVIMLKHFLYSYYAELKGFQSYISKENNLFNFITLIEQYIPNAKFIYLYRDARDVVLSQTKRPTTNTSLLRYAKLWSKEQSVALKALDEIDDSRVYRLPYEHLISNEEEVLTNLLSFIGVNRELNPDKEVNAGSTHEWENLNKPIISDNANKYLKEFSAKQIQLIENQSWNQLLDLGYTSTHESKPSVSVIYKTIDYTLGTVKGIWKRFRAKKENDLLIKLERSEFLKQLRNRA